jgi:exodeoxyribonuclease VII large subunit
MEFPSNSGPSSGAGEQILTVAQLTRHIKQLLEQQVGACWIRGEISNLRSVASGHHYFTLKDSDAQLSAVAFRGNAGGFLPVLQEGRQVLAFGDVTVYEARGNYQLIVRHMMDDGVGRIQQEFERLKRKLSGEGLFDADRKQPLPAVPTKVAFLTSPTGAAIQDFRSNLLDKGWTGEIYVIPAIVQGVDASASLLAGLAVARQIPGLELLVLGRGGGSLEDLACFNDEELVRAVADFPLPIISAVGHEIDFVLTDFAADLRAETPTAAASHIFQGFLNFQQRTQNACIRLQQMMEQEMSIRRREHHHLLQRLQSLKPQRLIESSSQRLDELTARFLSVFQRAVQDKQRHLQEEFRQLCHYSPVGRLPLLQARIQHAGGRLNSTAIHQFESYRHQFDALQTRLETASLSRTLARGFSIVTDGDGMVVPRASGLASGDRLCNRFIDGEVTSKVE